MTETQKEFNKGMALLKSIMLSIILMFPVFFIPKSGWLTLVAIVCGIYAHKNKIEGDYYKKSGAWAFGCLIWLVAIVGLPYFFYSVYKTKAKNAGINTNVPKNLLFKILFFIWTLLVLLLLLALILRAFYV